jgi:glucose/mannose-6-phosphate isomerase
MIKLVDNFPNQLKEALSIANSAVVNEPNKPIHNVVVTGLGGSGIGGTILTEVLMDSVKVPVLINKDYFLPTFVNENTLLIVSSYSGNTEETVQAMEQAMSKHAQIVCVTSGGKILELAKQNFNEFIEIPGGQPPRSCIGFSLVQLIKIFIQKKLAPASLLEEVEQSRQLLIDFNSQIKNEAKTIADDLTGKLAVIYSLGGSEGVCVRFRQQVNENGKQLCWHHVFPEMNHNELVGWTERNENLVVVAFHTSFDFSRTKKRYEVCKPLFQKFSAKVIDVEAKGNTKLEQFFYLINIGDYVSCYIAENKNVDPVEVNVINNLKNELSKF